MPTRSPATKAKKTSRRDARPAPSFSEESEALALRLLELGPDESRWPRDKPWIEVQRASLADNIVLDDDFDAKVTALTDAQCEAVELPWLKTRWGGLLLTVGGDDDGFIQDEPREDDSVFVSIDLHFHAVRAFDQRGAAAQGGGTACADVSMLIQDLLDERLSDNDFGEDGQYATGCVSIMGNEDTLPVRWAEFCEQVRIGLFEACEAVVVRYLVHADHRHCPQKC